ncbi:hypothetical protein CIG19_16750 [Enterobacterales bacterium CwR94]|nr:hypothetical protein CIG19_16750 [Enterobacterales bacterium CwR94]
MGEFTKGTWRADENLNGDFSIVALRERYVVELGHIDDPNDAKLIAAAPELLDVLLSFPGFTDDAKIGDAWIEAKNRAIRKALGQ